MPDKDTPHLFEVEFLSGPTDGEVQRLYAGQATLGSTASADVQLVSDSAASERHARIEYRDRELWIEDLGSEHGTFVNREPLKSEQQIQDTDIIRVGHTELICRLTNNRESASTMNAEQSAKTLPRS